MSGYEMIEEDELTAWFWRCFRRGYLWACAIGFPTALVYIIGHYIGVWP